MSDESLLGAGADGLWERLWGNLVRWQRRRLLAAMEESYSLDQPERAWRLSLCLARLELVTEELRHYLGGR